MTFDSRNVPVDMWILGAKLMTFHKEFSNRGSVFLSLADSPCACTQAAYTMQSMLLQDFAHGLNGLFVEPNERKEQKRKDYTFRRQF